MSTFEEWRNKILPILFKRLQMDEGMINIHKRLGRLENDSHPPLFSKNQLFKVHKRLEDLETKAFVDKIGKYKFYEGSD